MIYLMKCLRCRGEGRLKFPPLDNRGAGVPATHEEPNPCYLCRGTGYRSAHPVEVREHRAAHELSFGL